MTNIVGSMVGTLAGLGQLSLTLVVRVIHQWGVIVQLALWLFQEILIKEKSASLIDCKSELEQYLLKDVEALTNTFDILIWWRINSSKCSVIAKMSRDILVNPITIVTFEPTFSTRGRVFVSVLKFIGS